MNGVLGGRRVLDALLAGQVVAGEVVVERAAAAQELDARLDQAVATAKDADAAAGWGVDAVLGLNLDDAGGALPNCAGTAPVTKSMWSTKRLSTDWPKPLIPSGRVTPLMRNWTLACSSRTWIEPEALESCAMPGNVSRTSFIGVFAPLPYSSMQLLIDGVDGRSDLRRQRDLRVLEPRRRHVIVAICGASAMTKVTSAVALDVTSTSLGRRRWRPLVTV